MNRPTTSHLQAHQASATGSQRFRSYKTRHLFVKSPRMELPCRIRTGEHSVMVSLTKCDSWRVGLAWDSKSFTKMKSVAIHFLNPTNESTHESVQFCDSLLLLPAWRPQINSCSIRKNNQMIPPTLAETKPHSVAWEQSRPHDNQQQLIATTSLFETCGSEVSAPRSLRAPGSSTYIEYMAGKQGKHPKGTNMKYWSGNDVNNFGLM